MILNVPFLCLPRVRPFIFYFLFHYCYIALGRIQEYGAEVCFDMALLTDDCMGPKAHPPFFFIKIL